MRKDAITQFSDLKGHTLAAVCQVETIGDQTGVLLILTDGRQFILEHERDCCESVVLEDVCGRWTDLVGAPLLMAEEATSSEDVSEGTREWTFYKLATTKGYVTLRFCGESEWYSTSVDFKPASSPYFHDVAEAVEEMEAQDRNRK